MFYPLGIFPFLSLFLGSYKTPCYRKSGRNAQIGVSRGGRGEDDLGEFHGSFPPLFASSGVSNTTGPSACTSSA